MQYVCELARDGSGFLLCQEIGGPERHGCRCSQPGQAWDRNGHAPSAMGRILEWCPTGQVLLLDLAQGFEGAQRAQRHGKRLMVDVFFSQGGDDICSTGWWFGTFFYFP